MLDSELLTHLTTIFEQAAQCEDGERCMVAASQELAQRIREDMNRLRGEAAVDRVRSILRIREPSPLGMNDGVIYPPSHFPMGTSPQRIRSAATERAPLRGTLRVLAVLVDFPDQQWNRDAAQIRNLFFAANKSVKEYYTEVTNGLVTIDGDVVGPYRLPRALQEYAHGASGMGQTFPNAQTMARDVAEIVNNDPNIRFSQYDNDGNSFIDAFIIIHAGRSAEETGSGNDIWSHKWVLSNGEYSTRDGTKIYAYLTIPEDARIGVCCHELGHLLFGFPDLYDIDYSSEGVGNWCLMGSGSWNGQGDVPAHPSAWCKVNQGWVREINQASNTNVDIPDVKTAQGVVYRLWTNGMSSNEYFLVENRQRTRYDRMLPGDGLLIWHIDDSIPDNSNEIHPRVALLQADGQKDLESARNRGDDGDTFPGITNNTSMTFSTNPCSKSYAGTNTQVAVTQISPSGATMHAHLEVSRARPAAREAVRVRSAEAAIEQLASVRTTPSPGAQLVTEAGANGITSQSPLALELLLDAQIRPIIHQRVPQGESEH